MIEERNVFCGAYSLLIVHEKNALSKERIIHCDAHGIWVAICEGGPSNRHIEFISTLSEFETVTLRELQDSKLSTVQARKKLTVYWCLYFRDHLRKLRLRGHAGTLHALWCNIDRRMVLSSSYDTSIRMWSLENAPKIIYQVETGLPSISKKEGGSPFTAIQSTFGAGFTSNRCLRIFHGHTESVTCLYMDEKLLPDQRGLPKLSKRKRNKLVHRNPAVFASGSEDGTCRVWSTARADPLLTLHNSATVTAVVLTEFVLAFADQKGKIKIYKLDCDFYYHTCSELHLKTIKAHNHAVTALRMNLHHIVSASRDWNLKMWSAIGDFKECLLKMPHPDEVLCVEMLYLRALTGCKDGKIRVWNLLNGQCQRIIRGNNKSEPITHIFCRQDAILFGTNSNLILLRFEKVHWDYKRDRRLKEDKKNIFKIMGEDLKAHVRPSTVAIDHAEITKRRAYFKSESAKKVRLYLSLK
ncbi:F-box/WD repeat-containing protein 10 [Cichlidogyrus casuarinus]|uniref:F-box/WD repeat-containing protein 10 n=1 Tax=Cichlidogyrus casuarinus TaxID=1844966 RepID=A0ABD2Q476_9PLAT